MEQPTMHLRNPCPQTGLEESMWQLGLAGGYPERRGEPDCVYFVRTGTCGYGDRCRFNHPRNKTAEIAGITRVGGEYPERHGQPLCQYFLKTRTCKFGATCKYHHPKEGGSITVNNHGYPLRPGERECSYYVKTGQCKFGITCKFHHPEPAGSSVASPSPSTTFYPGVQSQPIPSPNPYPTSLSVGRPQLLSGSFMQGGYGSIVLPPGFIPVSGWGAYPPPASSVASLGQHPVQAHNMYGGAPQQLSASAPAYLGPYSFVSSPLGPSSSSQKLHNFPERPGQPDCHFYMRTGDCKFGPTCRYHHPREWSIPKTTCALNPLGLPLRPGSPRCTFYAQHGVCKFGPTCKFDHPMEVLSYSPSASSLTDMPVAPYPVGHSITTLAPSSSSSDIRPVISCASLKKDLFSVQMTLSENTPSHSTGSLFSTSLSMSHSLVTSGQITSNVTLGKGGEASGSS